MIIEQVENPIWGSLQLWCDNKVSIEMTMNPIDHDRTKHIQIDRYFIMEKVEAEIMTLSYNQSFEYIAYMMKKPFTRVHLKYFQASWL